MDNPADNVFHVKVKEALGSTDKVYLVYELSGIEDHTAVSRSVNDQVAVGGYLVKKRKGWSKQRELVNAQWLRQGDNVVRFTLPAGATHSYRVRNLSLQVEKAPAGAGQRELVVNQPLSQTYYQDQAYLKGFAMGEGGEKAQITVDGKKVSVFKGEFEALVAKPKGGIHTWTVTVEALYPNGQAMRKVVSFTAASTADYRYDYQKVGQTAQKLFSITQSNSIALNGASLTAAKGDLSRQAVLSITALREVDIAALDGGMVNVTKHSSGFRLLPHRTKFAKGVSLKLAYDENKIPEGYSEKDIKTYFFDEESHHWVALPTDTVIAATGEVFSRTTHFTDMINAIIKVPESPEVSAYNSTSIKGIKAANPTAGINLINAPSANNTGNASLTYPLNLPPGRNGMQPQMVISYNSGGGNGWLGLGWNMSTPAISIDTRWGVPRYDLTKETETYSLNGEQLSPVAHRREWQNRSTEKQFYPRVEGSFSKIIRHGGSPATYWWEVTDKSGTRYFYGGRPGTDIEESAVLRTKEDGPASDKGNVAYWALLETRDLDGNFVRYHYDKQEDKGVVGGTVPGYQLYLAKITYTGHGSTEGPYFVQFLRDRHPSLAPWNKRKDVIIQANLGFKQVTADKLKKVVVQFGDKPVRHYELHYKEGEFNKTLLSSISEHDAKGQLFTTHSFDYYNDVRTGNALTPFKGVENWITGQDYLKGSFATNVSGFTDEASVLSGTKSTDVGAGLAVTVGFDPNVSSKSASVGGSFSYVQSDSEGVLALIDLNGDGLPDKVFVKKNAKGDKQLFYRPNLSGPEGKAEFGQDQPITGISSFHEEKSKTVSGGLEAHGPMPVVIFAGSNASTTTTTTKVYFSEVNGDGLVDVVVDGKIHFNHIDPATGHPAFTTDSGLTPSPVNPGSQVAGGLQVLDPTEQAKAEAENPLHDMVRVWQAPYAGRVTITAPVQLIQDLNQGDNPADGVRVVVQHKGQERWQMAIAADDYSVHTPSNVSDISVQTGDRIYFRVQSVKNGSYDQVQWHPVIEYLSKDLNQEDASGKKLYRFAIEEDFLLTSRQEVSTPIDGKVRIEGTFQKPATSDDLHVAVLKVRDKDGNSVQVPVWEKDYAGVAVVTEPLSVVLEVLSGEAYAFRVVSQTNVDWPAIHWSPRLYYTSSQDSNYPKVINDKGEPLLEFFPVPEFSVFANLLQISKPFVVSEDVESVSVTPQLSFVSSLFSGPVTFSVKKNKTLLLKQTLIVTAGQLSSVGPFPVAVTRGESLYMEYHFPTAELAAGLLKGEVSVRVADKTETAAAGVYAVWDSKTHQDILFGPRYRGWGHFAYNGNGTRAAQPVNEAELKLSEALTDPKKVETEKITDGRELKTAGGYDPSKESFILLVANGKTRAWGGYDAETYLNSMRMSASRLGEDDINALEATPKGGSARAVRKISRSTNASFSLGVSVPPLGASKGQSIGDSKVLTDFSDMNGDRYPDVVTEKGIQYTTPTGGLSGYSVSVADPAHKTNTTSEGLTLSGSIPTSESKGAATSSKKVTVSVGTGRNSAGLSGNFASGTNDAAFSYLDINGDGLPDRVYQGGDVSLNLGYGFTARENWGFAQIQSGDSKSEGGGLGISLWNGSISAGVGLSRSDNHQSIALQDVNGDGLLDQVMAGSPLRVSLNTGSSFAPVINWTGASQINESSSASESANVAFTVGITIGVVKICFNPSINAGQGMSRELVRLSDVDGDGYPDYLASSKDNELTVLSSTIGRTNLLKSVQRPLGAAFVMNYARQGNTYRMAQDIRALESVKVFDGFTDKKGWEKVDTLLTSFTYEEGYYDRHEREFYGFGKVTIRTHDTGKDKDNLYRSLVQTYSNDNYFTKGLLLTETLLDREGNKYTQKENKYELKQIVPGEVFFPAITQTEQRFYEGGAEAGKRTRMRITYSRYGNMTSLLDEGDISSTDDDLSAEVNYYEVESKYIMATPKSITVTGGGKTLRRRESVMDQETGNVTQLKRYLESGEVAQHDMEYDPYGNLIKITRPANVKGERLNLEYTYDPVVHSYVTTVTNSYGYRSEAVYDYRFGQLLESKDLNGQPMRYTLDDQGRIVIITGPYEIASNGEYTIRFTYHPEASVPYATTEHYDPEHRGDPLVTSTFVDGLGRVLQIKKDIALYAGENQADMQAMTVSGRVLFDGLGRTLQTFYPVSELNPKTEVFNNAFDKVNPTVTAYDMLDRTLSVTLPDGATTKTAYGFSMDRQGQQQFSTKTTDANGKMTEQFTDARGQVTAVKNYTSEGDVWTSFRYNAMSEQIEAVDDLGHKILSEYDWLGRRVSRVHPDAGLSTYKYDLASNLVSMQTANLQKIGEVISYAYDYERLTDITYPQNPENNVHYTYGEAGASHNRAGRIVLQEDASGAQEFFYGPLGETVKNIRTVVIPQHGAQTYTTEWGYDTWNRLTQMVYADGEEVNYAYNTGGLLQSMSGKKGDITYPYVKQLGYDKFEQRVFLHYGNGTKTTYKYEDERRRLEQMSAYTSSNRAMMDNQYGYDKVNNILSLKNKAPIPSPNLMGGSSEYAYEYDDLYRLTEATGHYKGPNDDHTYILQMKYNSVGGIVEKHQLHQRKGQVQKKTTYDLLYLYSDTQPHAATHIGEQTYTYDPNGNQTGWTHDKSGQRRRIYWDEENRIRAVMDNGATFHYVYDAQGERVLKGHSSGQAVYVNGQRKAGSGNMSNYTVYVNPYLVLRSGGYTKHYYIESQRIVSKLGSGWDNSGKGPLEAPKAGEDKVNYSLKEQQISDGLVKNLKFLGQDGQILAAGKSGKVPPGQLNGKDRSGNGGSEEPTGTSESFQYFFHPDHLGSTSYVTDASGEVYQHLEYFAFGETFVEEHSNTNRTPYLFNGKELDEETGLYMYGKRYYDPRISIFYGIDPLADKYPHLSPYNYASNNPTNNIDLLGFQGLHYMEVLNNGTRRNVIEKNVIVLTQAQKTIPPGASQKKIDRINRQNARIAVNNAARIQSVREELNTYFNGAAGQRSNSRNEPVRFQFNVRGMDVNNPGGTPEAQLQNIAMQNGMNGAPAFPGGPNQPVPAVVITTGFALTGENNQFYTTSNPDISGATAHEVGHTLMRRADEESRPGSGGLMVKEVGNSVGGPVQPAEVDKMLQDAVER